MPLHFLSDLYNIRGNLRKPCRIWHKRPIINTCKGISLNFYTREDNTIYNFFFNFNKHFFSYNIKIQNLNMKKNQSSLQGHRPIDIHNNSAPWARQRHSFLLGKWVSHTHMCFNDTPSFLFPHFQSMSLNCCRAEYKQLSCTVFVFAFCYYFSSTVCQQTLVSSKQTNASITHPSRCNN